jgi:hypothetical protein
MNTKDMERFFMTFHIELAQAAKEKCQQKMGLVLVKSSFVFTVRID